MLSMPRPLSDRRARAAAAPVLFVALVALAVLAGCGGKQGDGGVLLATVGDTEIRSGYYEDRLKRFTEDELPKGPDGMPMDMAGREGKSEFLTTLIHKELMVGKATQLGYGSDQRIVEARKALLAYEAGLAMWSDVVGNPANTLSNEEVDAFYANLGRQRQIRYVICNSEADAEAARAMAAGGADWDDVVIRYHDGSVPTSGTLEMLIPWGRFDPKFEGPIFAVEVGGLTPPVWTEYGWWIIRVDSEQQGQKPAREEALARILDITRNRKIARLREDFRAQVRARYKLVVEDEALLKCWQGLPEKEEMIDPDTNQAVPQDRLLPLAVAPADLVLPFYSYVLDGKEQRFTLGDYKIRFDRMNTFQRPKKGSMMGGLRSHIVNEVDQGLLDSEARRLGYYENPEVLTKVDIKIEEMMVTAFYGEIVTFDDRISPEQLQAYWDEHQAEYARPERRTGRLVLAADEAKAREAHALLSGGARWLEIVGTYCTDEANKRNAGKLSEVPANSTGPVRDALFAAAQGQLAEPFPAGDGRWGVVQVDVIVPGGPVTLLEVSEAVGRRIKAERKEQAFQDLLAQWAGEFGVERFDDNLDQVKSWKELTHVEAPGPAVPRN
ncbi:MAG: peptidyl-prolyl cis-trans isomerase [Krumholzibacteria bacterium]|nr:peptidyl-prolyl cis-trans isomerase [Candidatus Krumholzibacteria bacterium]